MERLQWSLWHGQVDQALGTSEELETSMAPCSETYAREAGWVKALLELRTSIVHHRPVIPHDGASYRHGEPIATGCVEATVHEVVSKRCGQKPHMAWSKAGAPLLRQTRVRTLHGAWAGIFKRW
jgi:hypothetical protein